MNRISDIFGLNTFDYDSMREKLPKNVYEELMETISKGSQLNIELANTVAHAMKEWALEFGVTHFTHWFQPLSRGTAEKHDSFLKFDSLTGNAIERFTGDQLVQAEPDASSFPSGGMRSTFEARGYTAWDPTSPAFIVEHEKGKTLCIPSVFVSYTGDALDKKTPLLRSINALEKQVKKLLLLLGKPTARVVPTVGPEQEFFLIPYKYFIKRPDLLLTGRTVLGKDSPRGQKLEDHYFGTIPENILNFFSELENEAYKLGIPLKTRHNEVAPSQFELAPIYENVNIGNDHNQLLMQLLHKIAIRNNLACLLYEKPFANVNGSGKHNNWSISTFEKRNLLDPGNNTEEHYEFLLILSTILHGVHKRARILRSAVATPGNDYRLGANEAPPAIMSVFIGSTLENMLNRIVSNEEIELDKINEVLDTGLSQLPNIRKHNTDRNRTSPFAFTGDKFEFRAVGSSQTLGFPNAFLNTIFAESFEYTNKLMQEYIKEGNKTDAIIRTIKTLYSEAKMIVFNGDNYSKTWLDEAEKRGLPNIKNTYEALKILIEDDTIELFTRFNVLSEKELHARYNVQIRYYVNQKLIEADVFRDMIKTGVLPAIMRYLAQIYPLRELIDSDENCDIKILMNYRVEINSLLKDMDKLLNEIKSNDDISDKGKIITYELVPLMLKIRTIVDKSEEIIPKDMWPWPDYVDLLHAY